MGASGVKQFVDQAAGFGLNALSPPPVACAFKKDCPVFARFFGVNIEYFFPKRANSLQTWRSFAMMAFVSSFPVGKARAKLFFHPNVRQRFLVVVDSPSAYGLRCARCRTEQASILRQRSQL
jgi:hypothetical protein